MRLTKREMVTGYGGNLKLLGTSFQLLNFTETLHTGLLIDETCILRLEISFAHISALNVNIYVLIADILICHFLLHFCTSV